MEIINPYVNMIHYSIYYSVSYEHPSGKMVNALVEETITDTGPSMIILRVWIDHHELDPSAIGKTLKDEILYVCKKFFKPSR